MKHELLPYFYENQSKLHSICLRIYSDDSLEKLIGFYGSNFSGQNIKNIPINMTKEDFKTQNSVAVFNEDPMLLGYVKDLATDEVLLIGPVRIREITEADIYNIMRKYSLPKIIESGLTHFLLSTPLMLIENFLTMLSNFYLCINEEVIPLQKILGDSKIQAQDEADKKFIDTADIESPHASGEYEEALMYYIKNGMVDEIENLNFEKYTGKVGKLGPNYLRSLKNSTIILNALCLRAAVSGGLDPETAYSLGERYAQRIEEANSLPELGRLTPIIRLDYCKRVKELSAPVIENIHLLKVTKYIQKNIYSKITVAHLAEHAGISPEYLSLLSKQCLHCTMTQYIIQQKIFEAKKLLRFTNKSLAEIANLLCFSSQSHFQNHFKKIRGITPSEYRKLYQKNPV